ncbi:MAG: hypothetical protein L0Y73_06025 [Candidatus Aminicenantes bacterium]|nr:hypothetical protein [Candidatus Aminicenantes bacterium]
MKKTVLWGLLFAATYSFIYGDNDVNVFKEPKPLFSEISRAQKIELVKKVEEIDNKNLRYFSGINSVAVDKSGNYYIFDYTHCTIIKLDRDFRFVTTISRNGKGPGEFNCQPLRGDEVSIGLDEKLYLLNIVDKKIIKFTTAGGYIDDHKIEQFGLTRVAADKDGNLYLPSVKGHIIDVHKPDMTYEKSFLPGNLLKSFLFYTPDPCVIYKHTSPSNSTLNFDFLGSGDLVIANKYDLSITVLDRKDGKIKNKFYAWDEYILSEYKVELNMAKKMAEKGAMCPFFLGISRMFIDDRDQICIMFNDANNDAFIYRFAVDGDLKQVYAVAQAKIDEGPPTFFQGKDDTFVGYTHYGLYVYKIKDEAKK